MERQWPFRDGLRFYDLDVTRADDITILPRNVFLSRQGRVMRRTFAAGRHRAEGLKRLQGLDGFFLRDVVENRIQDRIDEPVFVVDSPWSNVFGHWLVELAPMLMLRKHAPADCLVVTSAPFNRTLMAMFAQLGVRADRIARITGPLRCREAYFPQRLVRIGDSCHPLAFEAFAEISRLQAGSVIDRHDRVFVSRAGIGGRRLDNETEVEEVFAGHGFHVMRPEAMPIEDQLRLFGGARMLAGLGGSAMHNAVFAPADCPVLIVQTGNMTERTDMTLTPAERRLGFVFGESLRPWDAFASPWHVELADVEAGIRLHFGL